MATVVMEIAPHERACDRRRSLARVLARMQK